MARIGLKNFRYGILDEETETYESVKTPGKAVDCKVSLDLNSAELYADDSLAESDYSFKKGTISLEVAEEGIIFAKLLGHAVSESDGNEVVRSANDVAPYVAVGRILTKMVNNVKSYKVEFLSKVQFKEPATEEKTKGESIEFGTAKIEGTIMQLADGTWSKAKTFATYTEAETYLNGLLTAPVTE